MSRLIIVDQSLKGVGGHHFDYTLQVAKAAAGKQCEVLVATHRKFRSCSRLDHFSHLYPVFRNTTYSRFSLLAGLRAMFGRGPLSLQRPTTARSLSISEQLALQKDQVQTPRWTRLVENQQQYWSRLRHRVSWQLQYLRESSGRNRVVKAFAADCESFFRSIGLREDDHVFFPTVSDLDLAGLLTYWMRNPESHRPAWHMQFHFDVFVGRSPDYRSQLANVAPLRELFDDIERALPSYQLHYYATTDSIADQYQRLSSRQVTELAYPISDGFLVETPNTKSTALRLHTPNRSAGSTNSPAVTLEEKQEGQASPDTPPALQPLETGTFSGVPIVVAGQIRLEKGQACLTDLLPMFREHLFDKQLGYLVCQRKQKTRWWKRSSFRLEQSTNTALEREQLEQNVCYLPHPLDPKNYQALIRQTGIGLLAYDRESYANRRAGIFGEYLAAGVPVLVPAGTWMANCLEEVQQNYLQRLSHEADVQASWNWQNLDWAQWNVPSAGGCVSFDGREVPACAWTSEFPEATETDHQAVLVRFQWQWPREAGTFCKVHVLFHSRDQQPLGNDSYVVGRTQENLPCAALFHVPPGTTSIRIGFSNAYHERNAAIHQLEVELWSLPEPPALGAIGLTYDQPEQIPERLVELCENLPQYRARAVAHARLWFEEHDPGETVNQILTSTQSAQTWAA